MRTGELRRRVAQELNLLTVAGGDGRQAVFPRPPGARRQCRREPCCDALGRRLKVAKATSLSSFRSHLETKTSPRSAVLFWCSERAPKGPSDEPTPTRNETREQAEAQPLGRNSCLIPATSSLAAWTSGASRNRSFRSRRVCRDPPCHHACPDRSGSSDPRQRRGVTDGQRNITTSDATFPRRRPPWSYIPPTAGLAGAAERVIETTQLGCSENIRRDRRPNTESTRIGGQMRIACAASREGWSPPSGTPSHADGLPIDGPSRT